MGVVRRAATRRVDRSMSSSAIVGGGLQRTWDKVTDVDIADFSHPTFFKLVGIPHPLRAEVLADGVDGERIAYFDTGKRFIQRITVWDPLREYAFTFNPEKGFTVVYLSTFPTASFRFHRVRICSRRTARTLRSRYRRITRSIAVSTSFSGLRFGSC